MKFKLYFCSLRLKPWRATAKNRESRSEEHKEAAMPWKGESRQNRQVQESRGKPWETTERSRRAYGKGHEE